MCRHKLYYATLENDTTVSATWSKVPDDTPVVYLPKSDDDDTRPWIPNSTVADISIWRRWYVWLRAKQYNGRVKNEHDEITMCNV